MYYDYTYEQATRIRREELEKKLDRAARHNHFPALQQTKRTGRSRNWKLFGASRNGAGFRHAKTTPTA